MNSKLLTVNFKDLLNGLATAVLTAIATYVANLVTITAFDWKQILTIAILAAIGYLGKKLSTDEEGKILGGWK